MEVEGKLTITPRSHRQVLLDDRDLLDGGVGVEQVRDDMRSRIDTHISSLHSPTQLSPTDTISG